MSISRVMAIIYAVLTLGTVLFQLALVAGAPLGAYVMGGTQPAVLSATYRVAEAVQAGILVLLALVVLSRARLMLPSWDKASRALVWVAVAVSALSSAGNLIVARGGERAIWAPVALALLASSLTVALGKSPRS